jgi:hypothetical protein
MEFVFSAPKLNKTTNHTKNKPESISDHKKTLQKTTDQILHLQRTIGNQAVNRLIQNGTIAPKLSISHHGSKGNDKIQRKYDHLFNDVPKSLSNLPKSIKSSKIESIRVALNELRDDPAHGNDDVHPGPDKNATDFGLAQLSFLTAGKAYPNGVDERGMREATYTLWKYSVDDDVATNLGNVSPKVKQWHSLEKTTWEALTRHTGIDE